MKCFTSQRNRNTAQIGSVSKYCTENKVTPQAKNTHMTSK